MKKPIILLGPIAAGKSTIANLLAISTGIPNVPMDLVRWYFYFKDGYNHEKNLNLPSFKDRVAYWKPFEAKAVQRILKEFPESIIDFGAGHSCYEDHYLLKSVEDSLKNLPNVFLLLPCEDREKSFEICNKRIEANTGKPPGQGTLEVNKTFIFHESNYKLAKHIVYTEGKTPEETAMHINGLLV